MNFILSVTGLTPAAVIIKLELLAGVLTGLRPERPVRCDDDCWQLMQRCWDGEASSRPHIGELEQSLRSIYHHSSTLPLQTFAAAVEQDGFANVNGHSFAATTFQETWSVLQ